MKTEPCIHLSIMVFIGKTLFLFIL